MATSVDQAVCPQCGHQGLVINTEDWKPVALKCPCRKCGWKVDLKQFWPKQQGGVKPREFGVCSSCGKENVVLVDGFLCGKCYVEHEKEQPEGVS